MPGIDILWIIRMATTTTPSAKGTRVSEMAHTKTHWQPDLTLISITNMLGKHKFIVPRLLMT